ncbi:hypothetical protein PQR05_03950 [Paraburkholderia sediminicola]|uniref:hypothetical protein n=1 Tax=Paraburkholderia sediminicola TaxID=458836 RepID=UPI0038B78A34
MPADDRIPSPTFFQLDRQAKFDAVTTEFSPFLQATGLPVVKGDAFDTPADYRAGLVAALNGAVPDRVDLPRAELRVIQMLQADAPRTFAKVVLATKAAAIAGARTGDRLMPVTEVDRTGRESTSFYGPKRGPGGWLDLYTDKPRLMRKLGDVEY